MQVYWHATASQRIKVADDIESFYTDARLLARICTNLEGIELGLYEDLYDAEELKPILHHPLAKKINLHEIVIREGRMRVRFFGSIDGQTILYLNLHCKNREGGDYNHSIETAYQRYQSITPYGTDQKIKKSIRDFPFNPNR